MTTVDDASTGGPDLVHLVGASGFIGTHVQAALRQLGVEVICVRAPRVSSEARSVSQLTGEATKHDLGELTRELSGAEVVVNAAGLPHATSVVSPQLVGANALLPLILQRASAAAGASRFVHISSAAVQGRRDPLDESLELAPFSAYSKCKALAELALSSDPVLDTVIFRPTSVHGVGREVTERLAAFARSKWSSVAGEGTRGTPQALVQNVAAAIAHVATFDGDVPPIVLQPSEGLMTGELLRALGGKRPRSIPLPLATVVSSGARQLARTPLLSEGFARRLEILWFGQEQANGWLARTNWCVPCGHEVWDGLGRSLITEAQWRRLH